MKPVEKVDRAGYRPPNFTGSTLKSCGLQELLLNAFKQGVEQERLRRAFAGGHAIIISSAADIKIVGGA